MKTKYALEKLTKAKIIDYTLKLQKELESDTSSQGTEKAASSKNSTNLTSVIEQLSKAYDDQTLNDSKLVNRIIIDIKALKEQQQHLSNTSKSVYHFDYSENCLESVHDEAKAKIEKSKEALEDARHGNKEKIQSLQDDLKTLTTQYNNEVKIQDLIVEEAKLSLDSDTKKKILNKKEALMDEMSRFKQEKKDTLDDIKRTEDIKIDAFIESTQKSYKKIMDVIDKAKIYNKAFIEKRIHSECEKLDIAHNEKIMQSVDSTKLKHARILELQQLDLDAIQQQFDEIIAKTQKKETRLAALNQQIVELANNTVTASCSTTALNDMKELATTLASAKGK